MNRRGISTFLAAILLIVLTISAGVIIYAYIMHCLDGFGPQLIDTKITEISGSIIGYQYYYCNERYTFLVIVNDTVLGPVSVEIPSRFPITPFIGGWVSAEIKGFGSINQTILFDLRLMKNE